MRKTLWFLSLIALVAAGCTASTERADASVDGTDASLGDLPTSEVACDDAGYEWIVDDFCSSPPAPPEHTCPDGSYSYCIIPCRIDADCPGSRPFCRTRGLLEGGDSNCNGSVLECRSEDRNDCS